VSLHVAVTWPPAPPPVTHSCLQSRSAGVAAHSTVLPGTVWCLFECAFAPFFSWMPIVRVMTQAKSGCE
jgi:hypothetical protein